MSSLFRSQSPMRSLQAAIAVCGLLTGLAPVCSLAQVEFDDLKKIAEQAVAEDLVNVHDYKFQRDGDHVQFSTGAIAGEMYTDFEFKEELEELILAEHVREKTKKNGDFWNPVIENVERAIAQQFAERQRRPGEVPFDRPDVWMNYDKPLQTWANNKGYRYNDSPSNARSRTFTVQLVTAPAGATIYILPWLDYQISLVLKRKPAWRTVTTVNQQLTGTYYYFLRWRDGNKSGPSQFNVTSGGTHTLK